MKSYCRLDSFNIEKSGPGIASIGLWILSRLRVGIVFALIIVSKGYAAEEVVFPGANWKVRTPAEMGLDEVKLNQIAGKLGSSGCIIKDGFLVKTWGNQSKPYDWYSSAKPIFSTLLFFAIHEGKISSVGEKISNWDWPLTGKDRDITFRHLANMTSGYMQPEGPGEAYAHNDFAVELLICTLEKVFGQSITEAAKQRIYDPLGMQDNPHHQMVSAGWKAHGRAWISVRDWARLTWFWTNKGNWNGKQLIPKSYFEQYFKSCVPDDLPYSRGPNLFGRLPGDVLPEDYLGVRSFGGGSNHYSYGTGLYGYHWYFNASGKVGKLKLRSNNQANSINGSFEQVWPGLPDEIAMTVGWGINSVIIPSMRIVMVCAENANWDRPYLAPKGSDAFNYKIIKLLVETSDDSKNVQTME